MFKIPIPNFLPEALLEGTEDELIEEMIRFFNEYSLPEAQELLWKLYKGWCHYYFDVGLPEDEQSRMQYFFEELITMIFQPIYILVERRKLREQNLE